MHLRPQTVRRLARRSRWAALELPWVERARERLRHGLRFLGRPVVVLGGSLAAGIGLLWLPTSSHFDAFSTPLGARDLLSTLWQVEGGTITLTLTVILVAFEAIWRSRFRGSVRRFAEEVWL